MPTRIPQTIVGVNSLLDRLSEQLGMKTDASLADALEIAASAISNMRCGRLHAGRTLVLAAHEISQIPVAEIKAILATGLDQSAA